MKSGQTKMRVTGNNKFCGDKLFCVQNTIYEEKEVSPAVRCITRKPPVTVQGTGLAASLLACMHPPLPATGGHSGISWKLQGLKALWTWKSCGCWWCLEVTRELLWSDVMCCRRSDAASCKACTLPAPPLPTLLQLLDTRCCLEPKLVGAPQPQTRLKLRGATGSTRVLPCFYQPSPWPAASCHGSSWTGAWYKGKTSTTFPESTSTVTF